MPVMDYKAGFDVGASWLKYAFRKNGRICCGSVRMPDALIDAEGNLLSPRAFADFLKKTKRDAGIPRGPAAVSLPYGQSVCRLCMLPEMDGSEVPVNLSYEFSDYVRGKASTYFYSYAACPHMDSDPDGQMAVMGLCAHKDILEKWQDAFRMGGFDLRRVLHPDMALVELVPGNERACFIDLGHRETRVIIIENSRVVVSRMVPVGGHDLDVVIAGSFAIDTVPAGMKKESGDPAALSAKGLHELCDKIALEVLKALNFYQFTYKPGQTVDAAYVIGGGSGMEMLLGAVNKATGLEFLDFGKAFGGLDARCAQASGCMLLKGGAHDGC